LIRGSAGPVQAGENPVSVWFFTFGSRSIRSGTQKEVSAGTTYFNIRGNYTTLL
jgi:hypothetical protein